MSERQFYNTIEKSAVAEFKDRGSKFIAYAFPVSSLMAFKEKLNAIKKEHPKATHHCFAYRLGLSGDNFRVSDDGEPSGSAGKPILGQIDSRELTDTLVVVVRYFGGTLLGVPGLINAYKTSATLALQLIPVVMKAITERYTLQFDYTKMNDVMGIVRSCQCRIVENDAQLFCKMVLDVPLNRLHEFLFKIENLYTVELTKET
ncbi:MAG TPA: YigZ family protein [Chitinophagaceae bacterium]|nr:YigZ family protein [Chitinophagaceae bacterium]